MNLQKYRFKEICEVINGRAYSQDELLECGKYPVLRVGNFFSRANWYYSDMELEDDKYCSNGDLLFAWSASFGPKIWDGEKVIYHYHIWKLLPKHEIADKYYLYYWLLHSVSKILAGTHGSVMAHITKKDMEEQDILLPDFNTQRKIAAVLKSLDDKIELNNKINENLEQQAQAIFKSWFMDFEPFGGKMPEEWETCSVSEIMQLHDAKRIPLSGSERDKMTLKKYPYYGATNILDYVDDYLFDGKYLLLGEDGTVIDEKGFPILQYVFGKFWVNNHAHIISGKNGYTVESLYLLFKQTNVRHIVTGAVQPKISQTNLNKIMAILPSEKILSQFNDVIQPDFSTIRNNIMQNKILAELRDSLLPKLMSGEIDVSNVKI